MASIIARELITVLRYKVNSSELGKYTKQGVESARKVERKLVDATKAQRGLNTAAKQYRATMDRAVVGVRRLVAAYIGVRGARAVLGAVEQQRVLTAQMERTGLVGNQLAAVQKELFGISQRVSRETVSMSRDFLKFRDALSETKTSTSEQLELFEALEQSYVASGTSASRADQLTRRFARNIAEGQLGTSTIQSFLDGNQAGLQALIKGLQETAPELHANMKNIRELARQGQLTSDRVLPALRGQLHELRVTAGKMPDTLAEAAIRFKNSFRDVIKGSRGAEHGLDGLIKTMDWLGARADIVLGLGQAGGIAYLLTWVTGLSRKWLLPLTLIVAAVEDIWTWFQGGDSMLEALIGPSEEWSTQINAVRDAFRWIKNNIFNQPDTPFGQWAAQTAAWGAAAWGVYAAFSAVYGVLKKVGKVAAAGAAGAAAAGRGAAKGVSKAVGIGAKLKGLAGPLSVGTALMAPKVLGAGTLSDMYDNPGFYGMHQSSGQVIDNRQVNIEQNFQNTDPGTVRRATQRGVAMGMPTVEARP